MCGSHPSPIPENANPNELRLFVSRSPTVFYEHTRSNISVIFDGKKKDIIHPYVFTVSFNSISENCIYASIVPGMQTVSMLQGNPLSHRQYWEEWWRKYVKGC